MKKFISFITCACLMAGAMVSTGCGEDNTSTDDGKVAVTAVTLNKSAVKLAPEATVQLTATVAPENATNKAVAWTSSKETVATVSEAGLVTAVAEGEATITATTEDGAKMATCKVTVEAAEVGVESISLNFTEIGMNPGDEATLEATVLPEAAENKSVKFRSSNPEVATVGRTSGLITAVANGEATITVTSYDNEEVTATCVVTVTTPVESITLNKTELVLIPEAKETLVATILPETASNKNVTWSSSAEDVAKVVNGEVTAVAEGEATITASTEDGAKTATCAVKVKAVDEEPLKVVSFNITVSNSNLDNQDNYWNNRKDVIIKFIKAEMPDVMGMQEVTEYQLTYLKNNLSGYDHYGINRGGNNNGFERTSIMYNTATVEVLEQGTFWLSPTPDVASKSWLDDVQTSVEGTPGAMKYNRTCTWIKFKRKSDNKVFFYYNTHLEFGYHSNYNLGQTAREKGVALIVERIKAKATNGEPVIFGGDMNQVANDKCFNAALNYGMVSGRVTATRVLSEQNRNSITWNDYNATEKDALPENSHSPNSWNMIDHFFLKNCNAVEFRTIRNTTYGGEMSGKDNGSYMADHYPILITVAL